MGGRSLEGALEDRRWRTSLEGTLEDRRTEYWRTKPGRYTGIQETDEAWKAHKGGGQETEDEAWMVHWRTGDGRTKPGRHTGG